MNVIPKNTPLDAEAWPLAEVCICVAVCAIGGGLLARLMTRRLPKRAANQLTRLMIGAGGVVGLYLGIKLIVG